MRHTVSKYLVSGLAVLALGLAVAPLAMAGALDAAIGDAMRGENERARAQLVDIIEDPQTSSADLARAGWWALQLEDLDLLQRLRAVGEQREGATGEADAHLIRAIGLAWLGSAEVSLKQGGGSNVALAFADAATRAKELTPLAPAHGVWLEARTLWAQGDRDGALAQLAAYGAKEGAERSPLVDALEAGLRYERGLEAGTNADGSASEAAATDFKAVIEGLAQPATLPMLPARRQRLMLTRAWAQHRLWQTEAAHTDYMAAYPIAEGDRRFVVQGLQSLHAHAPDRLAQSLQDLAASAPNDVFAFDILTTMQSKAGKFTDALQALEQRLARRPEDPLGWVRGGDLFSEHQQWTEALRHYTRALEIDPNHGAASYGFEVVARAVATEDFVRCVAIYERLLALRPNDPFSRNNLGFLLREAVSPWTTMAEGQVQTLRADAPPEIAGWLDRCRDVYAEATALIPEEDDDSRPMEESWNLAGIVNDYALMIHYFADIQDVDLAERLYWRVLRMTDGGFKDAYAPNLQRLYGTLRPERLLSWYRAARLCKDAIQREVVENGQMRLVDDPRKQAAAAQDEGRLRARIVLLLKEHTEEDGSPWPPAPPASEED